ncbi:hypothetical protein AKO1_014481, partial [Acrasis kona]
MLGDLVLYQKQPPLPLFISPSKKETNVKKAVLCIAGMTDGLLSLPYTQKLIDGLPEYHIVQMLLSSSYNQWGLQSLDSDADQICLAVLVLVEEFKFEQVVIFGHSTGCQDVIHTLLHRKDHACFPHIRSAVMQAPVSDREAFIMFDKKGVEESISVARSVEDKEDLLPRNLMSKLGWNNVPMTARRWLSVADLNGQDDYFSSDLSNDFVKSTFGQVTIPLLALIGEKDEYMPPEVDKQKLVDLWRSNSDGSRFEA